MKMAPLQQLRQLDPVLDIVEIPRFVAGVSPQARRLMAAARLDEGVEDELLLGTSAGVGPIGG